LKLFSSLTFGLLNRENSPASMQIEEVPQGEEKEEEEISPPKEKRRKRKKSKIEDSPANNTRSKRLNIARKTKSMKQLLM
jgi:hypothetical protein